MSHRVFLSHAKEDRATASALCRMLEERGDDIHCWIAPRDVDPGDDWATAIEKAMRECAVLIVVLTPLANQSDNVYREVSAAGSKDVKVVTFQLDGVEPGERLNYYLRPGHWMEGSARPTKAEVDYLVEAVRCLVSGRIVSKEARNRLAAARRRRRVTKALTFVLPLLIAAGAIAAAIQAGRHGRPADDPTAPGALSLHTTPPGATVFLDGDSVGTTPLAGRPCEPGPYAVALRLAGHVPRDTVITIGARERVVLALPLAETVADAASSPPVPPEAGSLSITSAPAGAAVWIGGKRVGTTPLANHRLPVGRHHVTIRADGYDPDEREVEIRSGENTSFGADLDARTGSLRVTSEPPGAEAWIDGRLVGSTPCTAKGLAPGEREVVFRMPGFSEGRESASVVARREGVVHCVLERATYDLSIRVVPSGSIDVDGKRVSEDTNAPVRVRLVGGEHSVIAEHPTFGRWPKTVALERPATELLFDFTPKYQVTVISEPRSAEIWVNGEFTGKYTPSVLHLRPGERTIGVRKEGYRADGEPKSLVLEGDRSEPLRFELHEAP